MKKPIALILTDTHLSETNIPLVKSIWTQAIIHCQELNIEKIFFAGDFFTARKAQPLSVDEAGREIISNIGLCGIELTMIAGNHDKIYLDSSSSYIDEYSMYSNCLVIQNSYIDVINNLRIHFLPYFKENGSYLQKLSEIKVDKQYNNILITHIAVNGVKNNDGSKQENDIDTNLFNQFDSVFVGHFHNQSKLGDNIYYVGSAYQANFGEDNQKGFTILYDDGSHSFIKSVFKEFIKVKLNPLDDKAIDEAKKMYKNSQDNIRFVFEGEEAELKTINKELYADLGIEVTFNKDSAIPLNNEDLIKKASSVSFDRSNIIEAFEIFCQTKHIEDNSIGKSYLEKI
jgi:exonuclease SbcD